ncbi:MAG TPA: carboxylesterase family protein [Roseiflexaceae bacterium]|nr:carboxylesterase family protein [Roseiflexaceae bacterium]
MQTVDVEIAHGKIRGARHEGVTIFKGIPYAGRVSGDRRFRRPTELQPWPGVRDALHLGAPAIQPSRPDEPEPAEDCLFLNIWTPATDNQKRPVMFYSHGGGFVIGSGGSAGQDGTNLARNFDVVVVQTNHRLGLLGFLYLDELAESEYQGSGNQGLLDIVAALSWVNKHIGLFGGDPDNVMIFGESGGGAKTSCLYAMPAAAPYFNKASIESGPGVRMLTREMAAETTAMVLQALSIAPGDWRKLLDVPAAELLRIQSQFPPVPPHRQQRKTVRSAELPVHGFGPVVDGGVLPAHPFDPIAPAISNHKPLITGWNEDEYTFFAWERGDTSAFTLDFDSLQSKLESQYGPGAQQIIDTYRRAMSSASAPDLFVAIASITMMGLGSVEIAEKKAAQQGAPVYLYQFGYKSEMTIPGTEYAVGTPHAMDITFKFNNETPHNSPGFLSGNNPDRFVASHTMAELWTNFARTGKPTAAGVPEWPAYSLEDRSSLRIDTRCEVIHNRFGEELAMWRSIGRLA